MGLSGRRPYLVVLLTAVRSTSRLPLDNPNTLSVYPNTYPQDPPRLPKTSQDLPRPPNNLAHWPAHWPPHQLITKTQPDLINPNCRLFRVRGQLHAQINTYLSDHLPIKATVRKCCLTSLSESSSHLSKLRAAQSARVAM
jgi:hypothetical protein